MQQLLVRHRRAHVGDDPHVPRRHRALHGADHADQMRRRAPEGHVPRRGDVPEDGRARRNPRRVPEREGVAVLIAALRRVPRAHLSRAEHRRAARNRAHRTPSRAP